MRKSIHRPENLALIELLRELRVSQNIVQDDLAASLGVGQNFVSNVEIGVRRLDIIELRDYASALGLSITELSTLWEARIAGKKSAEKPKKGGVAKAASPKQRTRARRPSA